MHELAIADSIVRIACAHAGGRKVAKVELKVGHLRQVVPSALEFSFALVAEGTELEGAELRRRQAPGGPAAQRRQEAAAAEHRSELTPAARQIRSERRVDAHIPA